MPAKNPWEMDDEEMQTSIQPSNASQLPWEMGTAKSVSAPPQVGIGRQILNGLGSAAQFVGRQATRVPGAIQGAVEAYQTNDPYNAANKALQGLIDPNSVQSPELMFARFGADTTPRANIYTPPPGTQFNFKTMDDTPAQPETTYASNAQKYGALYDLLAPTGLEIIPGVAKIFKTAKGTIKGVAKLGALTADLATGTTTASDAMKGAGQGIKEYQEIQAAKIENIFNPKIKLDAQQYKDIGKRIGFTDDELKHPGIEFGELSEQARKQKALAQKEGGGPILERHNAITEKIQNGFDDAIVNIGGSSPLEPAAAGELIKAGALQGAKRITDAVTETHGTIIKQFPGLKLSSKGAFKDEGFSDLQATMNGVEKFAKGRMTRGVGEQATAGGLLQEVVSKLKGVSTYKQLNEARQMIGEIAFTPMVAFEKLPTYQQKLRDLYFGINDALIDKVGTLTKPSEAGRVPIGQSKYYGLTDLKKELLESNETLTELFSDEKALGKALGNKDKALESVYRDAMGDTRKIQALKKLLTPEQFNLISATKLNDVVKKGNDVLTYKSARNSMNNSRNKPILSELFIDNPESLKEVKDIVELGDRVGAPLFPGSAGAQDFGGINSLANPIGAFLAKATEPAGFVATGIGKQRATSAFEKAKATTSTGKKTFGDLTRLGIRKGAIQTPRALRVLNSQQQQER